MVKREPHVVLNGLLEVDDFAALLVGGVLLELAPRLDELVVALGADVVPGVDMRGVLKPRVERG